MIKAGYAIEITSWENDGDFYNTKRFDGLSLEDCRWRVAVCEYMHKNMRQEGLNEEHVIAIYNMLPVACRNAESIDDQYDIVSDVIYNLVGYEYESGLPRVCESWSVYFIQSAIEEVSI